MPSSISKSIVATALLVALLVTSSNVSGEAYCALRDPVRGIDKLFPQATSYRSIVKTIDESIRMKVQERMPPNTLHFGELGRHTLYVPVKDEKAMGYVHVRSEESKWGLVEIAWALDTDLRIVDFSFQRCRCRNKKFVESAAFKQQIIGKNFTELLSLLDSSGLSIDLSKVDVPMDAGELPNVVMRCALKTLLVTELAWASDIAEHSLLGKAKAYFGDSAEFTVVTEPYSSALKNELRTSMGADSIGLKRDSAVVIRAFSNDKKFAGAIYAAKTSVNATQPELVWAISPDREILGVELAENESSAADRAMFEKLIGKRIENAQQCRDRAELMTFEAVLTSIPQAQ